MDNKHVKKLHSQVGDLVTSQVDRDSLFESLKRYQSSSDVRKLVNELKRILNEPSKLEIYDHVRPLIRPQHQQSYDKMVPASMKKRLRVVKLRRKMNESFGFAVRGGYEHNIGIYVSHVEKGSQADQRGLRMGDEIVRVNGFTIAEAIHEEVLSLIKGRDEIELKVMHIGMVPIKQTPSDPVTWQYVDKPAPFKQQVAVNSEGGDNIVKIFINLRGASSLGCSIISGPKHYPGIYIETVKPGSLGEDYGLEVGDQIMEVNDKSFIDIKHKEAIVEIKGSKELNMVIKKGAGLPLLNVRPKSPKASPKAPRRQAVPVQDADSAQDICEILEEDVIAKEEKRMWEEEQAARRKIQAAAEEEKVREAFQRKELEKQKEIERKKALERKMEEDKKKIEEERRINQQKEREKEEERARFEQKMREEEEEQKRKQEMRAKKQQSAVLAGRSGPKNSMKPTLLGAATPSQSSFGQASDKAVKEVAVQKFEDESLDIELEGGVGSPLGGKILVADVYHNGAVDKCGEIRRGDQLLKVDGKSLVDISLTDAQEILWSAEQACAPGGFIMMEIIESDMAEDEVTYF